MKRRGFLFSAGAAAAAAAGAMAAVMPGLAFSAPARKSLPRLKTAQQATEAGLSFGYHSAGPEEGRPVVLLHDFAYDIHSYAEVIPLLAAQGYHVLVPYMRGHGSTRFNSKAAPRSGQPEALAADVLALIDSMHIPEAVVAGFGQGAVAARAFARLKPTRCKGILAIDGLAEIGPERAALLKDRRAFARKLWSANSPAGKADVAVFSRAALSFDNPDFVHVLADAGSDTAQAAVSVPITTLQGGAHMPQEAPQAFADAVAELVRNAKWRT